MTFRDQAIRAFEMRLGPAERSHESTGVYYRWRLRRPNNLDLHVIIDSPEVVTQAHVLLSDPCPHIRAGVRSIYLKTNDQVEVALNEIEDQWHLRGCWSDAEPAEAQPR